MKTIDRLKKSYRDVRRFAGLLRNYSIFATATSAGQLTMLVQKSFTHSDTLDWRIFSVGFAAGIYAGWVLENYYESATKELEAYSGKNYTQNTLRAMQKNTEWGFRTALSFNLLTFAAGTCAVIITAYQLLSPVDAAIQKNYESINREISRYEKRIDRLEQELQTRNISAFRDQVVLEYQKRRKTLTEELNRVYEVKIKDALKAENEAIKQLEGWKAVEMKKKINKRDGYRTLRKKYNQKLAEIKKPLAELRAEYKSRLKSLPVPQISTAEAKERYIEARKEEIDRLEAKIEAKKREREAEAAKISGKEGGIAFWKAALISLFLASLYYFYQNRNYRYQETLIRKIRDEEMLEERPVKLEPFDPDAYAPGREPEREEGRPVTDEDILSYMLDEYTLTGKLPGRAELIERFNLHTTELRDFYSRHAEKFIKEAGKKPVPTDAFFEQVKAA